MIIQLCRLPF
jgi:hypothetical protein